MNAGIERRFMMAVPRSVFVTYKIRDTQNTSSNSPLGQFPEKFLENQKVIEHAKN